MKKSEIAFGFARVPLDAFAVSTALVLAYRLREASIDLIPGFQFLDPPKSLPPFSEYLGSFAIPGVFLFVLLAAFMRMYVIKGTVSAWTQIGRVLAVTGLWLVVVNGWFFLVKRELFYSRALLILAVVLMTFFALWLRMLLLLAQRELLKRGIGRTFVVTVGHATPSLIAKETLEHEPGYTYLGHREDLDDVRSLLGIHAIDLVLQTDPNPGNEETSALLNFCRSRHVGYGFLPPVLSDIPQQIAIERVGLLPIMRFQPTPLDGWGRVLKRAFDIVVSLLLLIILSPVLILLAAGILLTSGWPVFYISKRVGQEGRRMVRLIKFRTMVPNADLLKQKLTEKNHRQDGPLFKMKNDPRITPFGHVLRRFSLDELPQLLNVLSGKLSLVGPRPHLFDEVERYEEDQRRVFAVKPGLTGLAQVSGRSDLTFQDEVQLDLRYIEEWSIFLDLWVLWRTIFVVLSRKGAD